MLSHPGFDPLSQENADAIEDINTQLENIETTSTISFANKDVRFFSELGLPDAQGWTLTTTGTGTITLVDDIVFGVEKQSIEFHANSNETNARKTLTGEDWDNILIYGASYSSSIRFKLSISNIFFSGIGFSPANDPRITSSARGRIGVFIGEDTNYTTIRLDGQSFLSLDGTNNKPLVKVNEWFDYEVIINPSPDAGVNFGAIDLYVNGVLIQSGVLFNPPVAVSDDVITVQQASGGGETIFYIENFGVTVYEEIPTKLLTDMDMTSNSISIVRPRGMRAYTITLPDNNPRNIGTDIKITASPSSGTVTLRTENLLAPQALFNGVHSILLDIPSTKDITFINTVEEGNVYQSPDVDRGILEAQQTGMIEYDGMSLTTPAFSVNFSARTMRFVDKVGNLEVIISRPAVDFTFTDGVTAPDDLGVVQFYEDISGNIFGSAKTDWTTPSQSRQFVYLGNADVNLAKDDFIQANNPLVSAYGLLDSVADARNIAGSVKGKGGKVSANGLGLDISGYTAVAYGRNFGNKELPHTPTSSDIILANLHLGYRTSDISMLFGPEVTALDPANYQRIEDTTLSLVPDDRYTIQRVYQYPGTDYNMVVYGSTLYDNLDQAIANASTERYNLHPSIVPACFLAYIVVRNDVTNLETAITNNQAAILNYDGNNHPQTIGAEASPILSLEAGGKLRSMLDQFVDVSGASPAITFIAFEQKIDTLYGCEWNPTNKTLRNNSQKDMIVNINAQIGRRSVANAVGLELFIDVSYDDGATWNVDITDSYAIYKNIEASTASTAVSPPTFRVVSNAMVRFGMLLSQNADETGIIAVGEGTTQPAESISGRELPSCELTIT